RDVSSTEVPPRSLSSLHEDRRSRAEPQPFARYTSPAASASAEMLHELALLPQLIEGSTIEGDAGIRDLEEKVGAYDRWVVSNRVAPTAAATALENAVRNGPVEAPHGTRPAAKDEAIASLRAIVSDVHEARGLVQRIEAALLRVGNL